MDDTSTALDASTQSSAGVPTASTDQIIIFDESVVAINQKI